MRFLCLHGAGTNAAIFSAQTCKFSSTSHTTTPPHLSHCLFGKRNHQRQCLTVSPLTDAFRSALCPQTYTFDFVDAPLPCPSYPGISIFFPPPYFSFWPPTSSPTPSSIRAAHAWLLSLLHRDGPYDGILCFSQGCSLISSFILYHNAEHPEQPLPFKCVIFICGGLPLTVLSDLGLPVSREAWAIDERTGRELRSKARAAEKEFRLILEDDGLETTTRLLRDRASSKLDNVATRPPFPTDRTNIFGLDYTLFPSTMTIPIPSVHIYGGKDPIYPRSMQLAHFASDERQRRVYDHGGGHEIPRTTVVSERIAALVEWLEVMTR